LNRPGAAASTTKPAFLFKMIKNWFEEPLTPLDFACFGRRSMGLMKIVERENGCVAIKFAGLHVLPGVMGRFMGMFLKNLPKQTENIWKPISVDTNVCLKKLEASLENTNDAAKLVELMTGALNEFGLLFRKRLGILTAPGFGNDFKLDPFVRAALGDEETARTEEILLRALPFRTALQNDALVMLARTAAESGRDSTAFSDALGRFLDEYGDRPAVNITSMPGVVTIREHPELIHGLLDAFLCDDAYIRAEENTQKQVDDFEAAKKRIEAMLTPDKRRKFRESLEKSRSEIIIREESSFLIERFTACIRRIAVKLGGILAQKAVINETEDIFFLFLEELPSAAGGNSHAMPDVKEKIALRKKAFSKVCAAHEKGVHWMVSTGSAPADGELKNQNSALKDTADTFHGVSASCGVYEGTVCIVRSPEEFGNLKKGGIMVSTYTSPVWTPLFKVAAAVVTEVGSPTSHAAIVAREYGIPAVVAIPNITTTLKNGQAIRVDGTNGTVTIIKGGYTHA
jgi:pyruvate,water dikinase